MCLKSSSKVDTDLDLAGQIQQLLFPKSSPQCSWCSIGVQNRMVRELGGDFFDFITMPDQCQSLILGDVTAHGLAASVVMSLIYGYLHRASTGECSPRETALGVNHFLTTFAERSKRLDYFFSTTLFFGIIHPQTLKMHYVNCGQTPPLVRQNGKIKQLPPTAPPLGFFRQPTIDLGSFQFQPGDRLLLYTDGLTETMNSVGEQFGIKRLARLLMELQIDHLEFLEYLFSQNMVFSQQTENEDDRTAIILDFLHPPGSKTKIVAEN